MMRPDNIHLAENLIADKADNGKEYKEQTDADKDASRIDRGIRKAGDNSQNDNAENILPGSTLIFMFKNY